MRTVKEWLEDVLRVGTGLRVGVWLASGALPLISFYWASDLARAGRFIGVLSALCVLVAIILLHRRINHVVAGVKLETRSNRRITLEQLETMGAESRYISRYTGVLSSVLL